MSELLPERKNLSRIAAAQVTRALPMMVNHLLYVKGNTRIASSGLVNFSSFSAVFNPLKPNDIYMSYRSANLQTRHFIYLFNKYTY